MTAARAIGFLLNGAPRRFDGPPSTTLLDHLREAARATGTKEGCAEGDCGACTVARHRLEGGRIVTEAVNSCILLMGQVQGHAITTVEGLLAADGAPHPLQRRLAETDGTQCGFCTPGFVMSLYALAEAGGARTPEEAHEALAGNLCRCTGYGPILATALAVGDARAGWPATAGAGLEAGLKRLARSAAGSEAWRQPRRLADLLAMRAADPAAVLVAGATDLGLLPARDRKPIARVIDVSRVPQLLEIAETADAVELGAAVSYARALPLLERLYPALGPYLRRLGSRQIRALGTFGGNLGTASPIGDALPVLLALDATIELRSRGCFRWVDADRFVTGYRRTVLAPDEVIARIRLPKLGPGALFRCDKVSKRYDQDISTVAACFHLRFEGELVAQARLAFGGMAPVPKRALAAEAALTGRRFDEAAVEAAIPSLAADLAPIDDLRGSAGYRMAVAGNLLRRAAIERGLPAAPRLATVAS